MPMHSTGPTGAAYLENLHRKRARSADLREGLGRGMQGVTSGIDAFSRLAKSLEDSDLAAEQKAHGREIEARNQTRADEKHAWDVEDRARKDLDRMKLLASATAAPIGPGGVPMTMQGDGNITGARAYFREDDLPDQSNDPRTQRALKNAGGAQYTADATPVEDGPGMAPQPIGSDINDIFGKLGGILTDHDEQGDMAEAAGTNTEGLLDRALANRPAEDAIDGSGELDPKVLAGFARNPKTQGLLTDEGWAALERIGVKRPAASPTTSGPRQPSAKEAAAAAKKGEADRRDSNALRKEYNALPEVKNFREVKIAHEKMKKAATNATAAGDLTLIFSFMKMQDPASTVRESEFAAAAKAGSYGDQVQATVSKVLSGERLSPAQRSDFMAQAQNFYDAQRGAYDEATTRYNAIATRRGANTADITTGAPSPPPSSKGAPSDAERSAAVLYRQILNDAQRARANELIGEGVDRVRAVNMALGGE